MCKSNDTPKASTTTVAAMATATAPANNEKKRVRFDSSCLEQEHQVHLIPHEYFKDCFYTMQELSQSTRQDVLRLQQASHADENDFMTWRGLEELRDGTSKTLNSKVHCVTVLMAQKQSTNAEELRRVSLANSKADRELATSQGMADAKETSFLYENGESDNQHHAASSSPSPHPPPQSRLLAYAA